MVTYRELDDSALHTSNTLAELVEEKKGEMSIYQLAYNANVSKGTIRKILEGKNTSIKSAAKVCRALGLTIIII